MARINSSPPGRTSLSGRSTAESGHAELFGFDAGRIGLRFDFYGTGRVTLLFYEARMRPRAR